MGNIFQFRRQYFRFQPRRSAWPKVPRRRGRLRYAPWQPLAALVGVAGILWFAAEVFPHVIGGTGAFPSQGDGAGVTSGNGRFVLCAGADRQSCVVDGDTVWYGGVKIRLEDIDAPEVFSPKCASELARGQRATRRLLELMNGGPFELVRAGARDEDRYGRKLRTIERAGRSVGDVLVAEGLARRWDGARHPWCG